MVKSKKKTSQNSGNQGFFLIILLDDGKIWIRIQIRNKYKSGVYPDRDPVGSETLAGSGFGTTTLARENYFISVFFYCRGKKISLKSFYNTANRFF
jgi:hypothetical protein